MRKEAILFALLLAGVLGGCAQTATIAPQVQSDIDTACLVAPFIDVNAPPNVQADVSEACKTEQTIAPIVAPLLAPAAAQ